MDLREIIKDELSNSITDVDFVIELLEISKSYSTTLDKLINKVTKKLIDSFSTVDTPEVTEVSNVVELKDYNLTNKKVVTEVVTTDVFEDQIELNKPLTINLLTKLTLEKQLILLTVAWCKRPIPTSYVCKQAQRLSFYFNLDKDSRWNEIDKWGKCKMRSDLIGALHSLKKQSYLEEKGDTFNPNSNAKHYYLTSLGLETVRAISDVVSFNPFDTAI